MTDIVGPYELAQLIGRGGMGEVWLAHDTRNNREVAIKLLAKQALTDPELQERFRRECVLAGQIRHSHILPVWDFSVDGRPYIVMPFIDDGTDLATILKNGPIKPERAVNIVRQVASALDAAHRKGLRHRDVKPSNIMVEPDGDDEQVLLFDWGIAQPIDTSGAPPVTRLDQLVGTPAYIAPERLGDQIKPDHRADVYSLAVVLFECLAGYKPFDGEDMAILTAQVLRDPPPLPDHLPAALRDVVTKGLEKHPDDRWPSAGAMANAASAALATHPAAPGPAGQAANQAGGHQVAGSSAAGNRQGGNGGAGSPAVGGLGGGNLGGGSQGGGNLGGGSLGGGGQSVGNPGGWNVGGGSQGGGNLGGGSRVGGHPGGGNPAGPGQVSGGRLPVGRAARSGAPGKAGHAVEPADGTRIALAGFGGAVVAFALFLTGVVGEGLFWLLLPLLAAGGGLVGFGLWGPKHAPVRPGDPTLDPGGFPDRGP